jgi:hypothetical protein
VKKTATVLLSIILFSLFSYSLSSAQSSLPPNPRNATTCGETIIALTTNNTLLRFNSDVPGAILSATPVTGLLAGESLLGIDYRPAIKEIWGISDQNRLYVIDSTTGLARLSATLNVNVNGSSFGVDFNPVPDRMRLVSNADQNLRINVETGATTVDGTLAFNTTDANAAANPNIVGAAYTNNFAGATTTTLYGIDANADALVIQNPPNNGTLTAVGSLGVDTTDFVGFDIYGCDGAGFASLTLPGETASKFYRINLATGSAMLIGTIGIGETIRGIAVR